MSEQAATVYLVGRADALKTNSWEAMTNSADEAERLRTKLGQSAVTKTVQVKPRRRARK